MSSLSHRFPKRWIVFDMFLVAINMLIPAWSSSFMVISISTTAEQISPLAPVINIFLPRKASLQGIVLAASEMSLIYNKV